LLRSLKAISYFQAITTAHDARPAGDPLYKWIGSVLDAAAKDPAVMKTLQATAFAADQELIAPLMQWRYNGHRAPKGQLPP
jgi:hypothetical protein